MAPGCPGPQDLGSGTVTFFETSDTFDAGAPRRLRMPGIEGQPRVVNDARNVAGALWMGDTRSGHVEAGFWPSYDSMAVGLGLLPDGCWSEDLGVGRVRVLPSLYDQAGDWHDWHATHAAHAPHAGLDQIGAGTHSGFEDGLPVGAPTVFKNASTCGVVVDAVVTTQHTQSLTESHVAREASDPLS